MPTDSNAPTAPEAEIDADALRRRYRAERDKRVRPDGMSQYMRLPDRFAGGDGDPYLPVRDREPVTDHVTYAFVGGGFAGLTAGARLAEAGVEDVRIIDHAGDFGGVWYWNRYPGIMCDSTSLVYMPLLDETGYIPTEKYAHGPEILEHARRIGRHYNLYDKALFHTRVTALDWDENASVWTVTTDRGDRFTAQFVGVGPGALNHPKVPRIPGIDTFAGHMFHTSRWDYAYTGGDDSSAYRSGSGDEASPVTAGAPLDKLGDKRVAVIGTGATSVQLVPSLAKDTGELFVFQRTPSGIDVRGNGPIDPEEFGPTATPGWQKRWHENFLKVSVPEPGPVGPELEDLVDDGWTEIGKRVRATLRGLPADELTPERVQHAMDDADFRKMERIRARVDAVVEDPETAAKLKPWYREFCKRPCFHDEYLQSFNRPNVHLVDTDGKGVERFTERAVVVDGTEYEVDCVIFASGFDYGSPLVDRMGYPVTGRGGLTLSEAWADGVRTLHGMFVHGFPNMFVLQFPQGAFFGPNIPQGWDEAARSVSAVVSATLTRGHAEAEVTEEAQNAWCDVILGGHPHVYDTECTPGYYNNEGEPLTHKIRLEGPYPSGPAAHFRLVEQWWKSGEFEGLAFRTRSEGTRPESAGSAGAPTGTA
ncbi:flavin-containing monooxygenase [Streptomyces hokutonensis]|uniref:flavin-containing monooxygenase n=1 Tax=Streptomyces hokutonensis TaxID=1306990 RepID=UPI0037F9091E